MDVIENRLFEEIKVGDWASLVRTLSREDVQDFAGRGGAMIAELLGTRLPGPGTTYVEQTLRFRRPVAVGEAITQLAGLVLGARVRIVLTSRADDPRTRMASCAIALLFARRGPKD